MKAIAWHQNMAPKILTHGAALFINSNSGYRMVIEHQLCWQKELLMLSKSGQSLSPREMQCFTWSLRTGLNQFAKPLRISFRRIMCLSRQLGQWETQKTAESVTWSHGGFTCVQGRSVRQSSIVRLLKSRTWKIRILTWQSSWLNETTLRSREQQRRMKTRGNPPLPMHNWYLST